MARRSSRGKKMPGAKPQDLYSERLGRHLEPWPPAPKGHRRGVRHGAHAPVLPMRLEETAQQIYEVLAEDAPFRDGLGELPAHDRLAVGLMAQAICRLEDVTAWLDEHGALDEDGDPRSATRYERSLRRQVLECAKELGMTPASRARLGLDLLRKNADVASVLSALRRTGAIDADAQQIGDD